MTERWQRDVRKLSAVEPERDVWKRASTRAPGGDGLPPPRQRVVAGVVAFGVFFAAASFGWLALRPTAEGTLGEAAEGTAALVTLRVGTEGSDTYPIATLRVDGVIHQGQAAPGNVWDLEGTSIPWLEQEPPYRPRDYVTIALPATLELAGDADGADAILHDPKSTFWAGADGDEIGPLGSPLPFEAPPGRYVLEVLGHWQDHGDPAFYFPIELTVVPAASGSTGASPTLNPSQPASDTLHVSCTDGGAVLSTPLVAVQADGIHVVVDEAGGFGELVLDPLDDFPLQFWSGSSGVDGEFARELVPGRWRAGCVVGPQQDRSSVVGWAEFEVIDPASFWIPTTLACGGGEPIDSVENGGTVTKEGDETPQEAIARVLELPVSDLVEVAGYEGSFRQAYRIVREGEIVAWALFSDWTTEWWRFTAGWACPGEGFSTEVGG